MMWNSQLLLASWMMLGGLAAGCAARRAVVASNPNEQNAKPTQVPVQLAGAPAREQFTRASAERIMKWLVDEWNKDPSPALWVMLAKPGDHVAIPGLTFGTPEKPTAGMSQRIYAEVIVLNPAMVPESLFTSFLHEYGHCLHRKSKPAHAAVDQVESEVAAIKYSLVTLE
jgi:hypothetical protein